MITEVSRYQRVASDNGTLLDSMPRHLNLQPTSNEQLNRLNYSPTILSKMVTTRVSQITSMHFNFMKHLEGAVALMHSICAPTDVWTVVSGLPGGWTFVCTVLHQGLNPAHPPHWCAGQRFITRGWGYLWEYLYMFVYTEYICICYMLHTVTTHTIYPQPLVRRKILPLGRPMSDYMAMSIGRAR